MCQSLDMGPTLENINFCNIVQNHPGDTILHINTILQYMTKQYVKFWLRISKMPLNSLIYQSYLENKTNLLSNNSISSWIKGLEKLLKYCSLGNVSDNENYNISNTAKTTLCKILYCKDWHNNINESDAKLRNYALYKTTFNRENYLLYIKDKRFRSSLTKLRISSHKLLIETGRHNKPCKIPADERFCTFFNLQTLSK